MRPHFEQIKNKLILLVALLLPFATAHATPRCAACPRDHNGHIQRSASAKHEFRKTHPCPSTGKISGACKNYVIDHIAPLCAGGADSPANMQWQEWAASKSKDKQEWRQCRELRRSPS